MYRLSLIILFFIGISPVFSQSPHGDELKIDCAQCHNSDSWSMNYNTLQFDHDNTDFKLEGAHDNTNCIECHSTLVFDEAPSQCASCHEDIHSMSVGNDCIRCHTSQTWLVDNIPELHEENGFPLIGAHSTLSCVDCHFSETNLRFDRIGNECINCHKDDYDSTQNPNHESSGFGTDCIDCHNPLGIGWETDFIDHDFFPLTLGHDIQDCNECHLSSDFSDISAECVSCHQNDYNESINPNHQTLNFTTDCVVCHTTDPDWMPARFDDHDAQYFPIYSGEHKGEWDDCMDCHTNPNNYSEFTCITCHTNPETDNEHNGISGYVYEDNACLACHPNGSENEGFDHNKTGFPLSGGHISIDCTECHTTGNFSDASPDCVSCHQSNYDNTTNPKHNSAGLSTDCASCHTTGPGWTPAIIDHDFFPLTLGHDIQDCNQCHTTGNFSDASPDCVTCHQNDYDSTTNPNHISAGFPTDCASCHTIGPGWTPASIDHDFFPLTLGHDIQDCNQCHTTGNFSDASPDCVTCHQNDYNNTTDPNHISAGFPTDCASCHTTDPGWTPASIDHDFFPLTLGHDIQDCNQCHTTGNFSDASPDCVTCHQNDYNNTTDPNHNDAGFPTDCVVCHTTNPNWTPANWDHNDIYPLNGAHANIADDCAACHNGDFNNTPNTCVGCHQDDYNNSTNPNHIGAQFPDDCILCHTETAWVPSTFDHDGQYFPINSGAHNGIWNSCAECHTNPSNYGVFTCITCHTSSETNNDHSEVSGYVYESNACFDCHPNGKS